MELEQYLERDILTFLDSKIEHKESGITDREEEYGLYITKDYLKELNYALDNDELTKAKKLFDELKSAYSGLPKTSSQRKKIYTLLEKMYSKIQNYVKIKEGKIEVIRQGDSEIQKERIDILPEKIVAGKQTQISKEAISDLSPINLKGLPIKSSDSDNTGDADAKASAPAVEPLKDDVSVESNILGKSFKDESNYADDQNPYDLKYSRTRALSTDYGSQGLGVLEQEIIDRTIELEKLKTFVIGKLLDELRRKLEHDSDEHNKRIEQMRSDIITQLGIELDKRISIQPIISPDSPAKMETIKSDILNKVYEQAPHIILRSDDNISAQVASVEDEQATTQAQDYDESSYLKPLKRGHDVIMVCVDDDGNYVAANPRASLQQPVDVSDAQPLEQQMQPQTTASEDTFKDLMQSPIAGSIPRVEGQDIDIGQNMMIVDDKDDSMNADHDTLIDSINDIQPVEETIKADDKIIYSNYKDIKVTEDDSYDGSSKAPAADDDSADAPIEHVAMQPNPIIGFDNIGSPQSEGFAHDDNQIMDIQSIASAVDDSMDDKDADEQKLAQMYEEAIYTMFQSNYDEAARIFSNILELKPNNKAARIRLQECLEAAGNA